MEPDIKKMKFSEKSEDRRCKHFVTRKKRFCKMTVAKEKEYCGEHEIQTNPSNEHPEEGDRIVCPLDPKHTLYRKNLNKHLKICNARPKPTPDYIVHGINTGSDSEDSRIMSGIKLSEVDGVILNELIEKIDKVFQKYVRDNIEEVILEHEVLAKELNKREYGKETIKHLSQTASILGYLERFEMLQDETAFVEFGAGKGQVTYWLGQLLKTHKRSKVLLIDKASHRHKKDNKLEDKDAVIRIRADIGDLCIGKIDLLKGAKRIVGVSKHLCGGATDLALRCLLQKCSIPVCGFIIALCCHHRCTWQSFIGKDFLVQNGFGKNDFELMTKMASWAICGTGLSREKNKEIDKKAITSMENEEISHSTLSLERRTEIGQKCKRVLDYARAWYMGNNNFNCSLKYYVKSDTTLENVCIVGKNKIIVKYKVVLF